MKVSAISIAVVASMATSVSAYPGFFTDLFDNVAGDINKMTGLNLGGGANGAKLNGKLTGGFQNLATLVNNIEPAKLNRLGEMIQWGIGNVTQLSGGDSGMGYVMPKAPDSILNGKWGSISENDIYNAFNLGRDAEHKSLGGLLFGPAEDEDHPFIEPGPGDKRGPCPALNTIANHGYIPRNGVVNPVQLFVGTFTGLSLGPDICAVLAFLGFIFKGDLTTMSLSIGGPHGLGHGLNSNGVIEGDASITRNDTYLGEKVGGNGWEVVPAKVELFKKESGANVTPFTLSQSRYRAFKESQALNPRFDFNPWRMLVAYGESGFVMENLRGSEKIFTNEMIEYWFIKHRFPPGWRRRAIPMTIPEILSWAAIVELLKPTVPGYSMGIPGLFLPIPTLGGLQGFFTGLTGGKAPDTIKGVGCAVSGYFLGWMPTAFKTIAGNAGISAMSGLGCD